MSQLSPYAPEAVDFAQVSADAAVLGSMTDADYQAEYGGCECWRLEPTASGRVRTKRPQGHRCTEGPILAAERWVAEDSGDGLLTHFASEHPEGPQVIAMLRPVCAALFLSTADCDW